MSQPATPQTSKNRVIVIGAGISGLATAALLARDGFQVTVLEKNTELGGRARMYRESGYSFDMGPSWYMMPEVFDDFFAEFGKTVADYYTLQQLDTHYKVFFSPTRHYAIKRSLDDNRALFASLEAGGGKKLDAFLAKAQQLYDIAMQRLVLLDYTTPDQLFRPSVIRSLPALKLFTSFHDHVASFFRHPDIQKILEFTTVFLGGSPYNTPAFYSLIGHTDYRLGVFHPMGGIHQIISALEKLCTQQGVVIKTGEPVEKIVTDQGVISTIRSSDQDYKTDYVVCGADYHFCETELLEKEAQTIPESTWESKTLAPSAFLLYLGIKGKISSLEHHNLYFSDTWEQHFDAVYGTEAHWPEHPSYYVHCPTRTDPALAPSGDDTVIILVPVAPGLSSNEAQREEFATQILQHLETLTGENITNRLVVKRIFAHKEFTEAYNAYQGTAFGLAHTLWQTALLRPSNRSKRLKNLFYTGQYTNPGVGMPTAILSAKIVRDLIRRTS